MAESLPGAASGAHADPVVRVLQGRAAIRDVLDRYASGVDRRDFEAVASCFAPDVRGRFGGSSHADREELLAFIRGVSHFDATLHWLGPARVELRGDRARATAPALIAHRLVRPDGSLFRYDSNETLYTEALAREHGAWRIIRRDAEPTGGAEGVRGLASADPAVAQLLDLAAVDDTLLRFGLERERRVAADSSTLLLGLPIVALSGAAADVQVTGLEIARSGRLEPGPSARPWSRRWQREELRCVGWRLRLARSGPASFDVEQADEERLAVGKSLPVAAWPHSGDPVVSALLARAAIRDAVARRARHDDLADARGVRRLLGSPMIGSGGDGGGVDPSRAETYCFEIEPGALWGDGACRLADEIEERDGRLEVVARRRLATRTRHEGEPGQPGQREEQREEQR